MAVQRPAANKSDALKGAAVSLVLVGMCFYGTCTSIFSGRDDTSAPASAEPTARDVLGVRPDVKPRYELINTDRPDIAGVPRLVVRVRVPRGLTREELEQNVRHALLSFYEASPVRLGAVSVGAFATAPEKYGADAAVGEFAPDGQWSAADPSVPLSKWEARITFQERYFLERKEFALGTRTILTASEPSETISLSSKAERWWNEDILAELKPGVPVVVVGQEDFGMAVGVRYEVETTKGPKRRGWVHSFELKAK